MAEKCELPFSLYFGAFPVHLIFKYTANDTNRLRTFNNGDISGKRHYAKKHAFTLNLFLLSRTIHSKTNPLAGTKLLRLVFVSSDLQTVLSFGQSGRTTLGCVVL